MVVVVVLVTTIDVDDNKRVTDTSSSFAPRDNTSGIRGVCVRTLLSRKLGTGVCTLRKYNGCVDDAIREDDTHAVRVMVGCRDRSMIRDMNIYQVSEYIGRKNIGGGCIDDIVSMAKDENEKKTLYHHIAYGAAIGGIRSLLMEMIEKRGVGGWRGIAYGAAIGGHMDIAMDMVDRGAGNWDTIAYGAARGGHKDIVIEMIEERGVDDWNGIVYEAARGGHMDIVIEMVYRGANDWNSIVYGAIEGGHMDIVDMVDMALLGSE